MALAYNNHKGKGKNVGKGQNNWWAGAPAGYSAAGSPPGLVASQEQEESDS